MQMTLSHNLRDLLGFDAHYTFTAAKYDEATWQRLLPNSLEGYRYHMAFELANVEGFKVGYISIAKSGSVICIAPIFITDYSLDSTVQGPTKIFTRQPTRRKPETRHLPDL